MGKREEESNLIEVPKEGNAKERKGGMGNDKRGGGELFKGK